MPTATLNRAVVSGDVSLAVASGGRPGDPTVVFIHGYPDTKEMWEPVMAQLADRFHVVAYDVRGAGASDAPRGPAAYHLAHLADDLARVCDELSPGRPVHLVGHDWGGIQGWEFVTDPRFAGRIASFTSIAGPALGHALSAARSALRRRDPLGALDRARRSWYVVGLCLPGGPTIAWRLVLRGRGWRRFLAGAERAPVDAGYPSPTVRADGLHGANLYRANIPRRLVGRHRMGTAHAPVQLIVPLRDRYISPRYYDAAGRVAPGVRRRVIDGSHWAPRNHPDVIARWIAEFAGG